MSNLSNLRCPLTTGLPTIVFSTGLVFSRHSETVTLNQTYNSLDCESFHPDQLDFTEYWNFTFLYITLKNYVRLPTVPLDQMTWETQCVRRMARGGRAWWRKFRVPNLKCSSRPDLACLLPTTAHTSIVGTVAQARIRCSVFSCRPHCHSCRWSSHSLLSWRMLWYRLYHVFVLIYLIVFITDCFIRKWCTKRILIPSTFVGSFCLSNWFLYLLVGLLSGCLVGCLVICFLWLVGWSVGFRWLVGFTWWRHQMETFSA